MQTLFGLQARNTFRRQEGTEEVIVDDFELQLVISLVYYYFLSFTEGRISCVYIDEMRHSAISQISTDDMLKYIHN